MESKNTEHHLGREREREKESERERERERERKRLNAGSSRINRRILFATSQML